MDEMVAYEARNIADLQSQQKKLRKQQIELRKSTRSSAASSPEQSENEEANIAYHPSHRVYGHKSMLAQELHAAYVVSQQVPDQQIETMVVDGGATSHLHHDSSKFNSIAPHKVPINTAKEGDVLCPQENLGGGQGGYGYRHSQ